MSRLERRVDGGTAGGVRDGAASFRARVRACEHVLGTVIACPDLALGEVAAAHLDFLWIDLEHSPLTVQDVLGLSLAARAGGAGTLVRLARADSELLQVLLDLGVDGVIAPRVDSAVAARELAAAMRYPPLGTRGFAHRRASGFGVVPPRDDEPPLCLVQIESRRAVEAAGEIAATAGVDGLILGPNDLAGDLGVAQDLGGGELHEAMAAVARAAARTGKLSGLAAGGDPEVVHDLLGDGPTLLAYSADLRIYAEAVARCSVAARSAWTAASRSKRRLDSPSLNR